MEAFGKKGDIVIALSTSGNSVNVISAVNKAMEIGCSVFGITGSKGEMGRKLGIKYIILKR